MNKCSALTACAQVSCRTVATTGGGSPAYKEAVTTRKAAKNRKITKDSPVKQAVAQLAQSLRSLPPTNIFRELVESLASASTNEQRQFAAVKLRVPDLTRSDTQIQIDTLKAGIYCISYILRAGRLFNLPDSTP